MVSVAVPSGLPTIVNAAVRIGSGERLGDLVLGHKHVACAGANRPQAGIPARLEKLGELRLVMTHNRLTRQRAETLTSEPAIYVTARISSADTDWDAQSVRCSPGAPGHQR